MTASDYHVYILYSSTLNGFYIGYTSNLEIRLTYHQNALPHKYTSRAKDWEIFYTIACKTKKQALGIEKHIKKMKSKIYIQNLIKYPEITAKLLERYMDC